MKLLKDEVVGEKDPYWRNALVIYGPIILGFIIIMLIAALSSNGSNKDNGNKSKCSTVYQKGGAEQQVCDDDGWYDHYVEEAERNFEKTEY